MRRAGIAGLLTAAALAAAAAPASADIHGFTNFAGTCTIHGTATFTPSGGFMPQQTSYAFQSAEGSTCTGTLNYGVSPVDTGTFKVSAVAANSGTISCAGSALQGSTAGGGNAAVQFLNEDGSPMVFTSADGHQHPLELEVRLDTYAVGNQVTLVITGGRPSRYVAGTMATGRAEFVADQATVELCAMGQVQSLPFTATISTGPSRRRAGGPLGFRLDSVLASLRPN